MSSNLSALHDESGGRRDSTPPSGAPLLGVSTTEDRLEEGDDDMDYEPSTDHSDLSDTADEGVDDYVAFEEEDEDEEETYTYFDAQEDTGHNGIRVSVADDEDIQDEEESQDERTDDPRTEHTGGASQWRREDIRMTSMQLLELLRSNASFQQLFASQIARGRSAGEPGGGDDDEHHSTDIGALAAGDAANIHYSSRLRRRVSPEELENRFPKIPSDEGRKLMRSGIYGSRDDFSDLRRRRKRILSERLMWRRLGIQPRGSFQRANRLISQSMVPSTRIADKIIHYDYRAYSGEFSNDGNFFFSCAQDFKVRMYDTSNPYEWKYRKTVDYLDGSWTITDATLSPDNRWLAYSSIRNLVYLAPTDPSDSSDPLLLNFADFANPSLAGRRAATSMWHRRGFGIWSLRFSGDGREIVAGTSDNSVVVYDLETRQSTLRLSNHQCDVNAVCFGDSSSPHILYSGSDDHTIRVWDRRSMGDGREAGLFIGHTEGLTYVDSKGDGRYVLSNGKDQLMKLWDLRKMMGPSRFEELNLPPYDTGFDYRDGSYNPADYEPNPNDCSVVTFRGHSVLRTLIRCHFSPPGSTDSGYVYSGSADGNVWIWNMDGTVRGKVDVGAATAGTRPQTPMRHYRSMSTRGSNWETCVRDASWHPNAPVLAATAWNGWGLCNGTVSLHSWNDAMDDDEGDPPVTTNYNEHLDINEDFNIYTRKSNARRRNLRRAGARAAHQGQGEGDGDGA